MTQAQEKTVEIDGQIFYRQQKSDVFKVDPNLIYPDYEFNIRTDYGDLETLKESIRVNGVKKPLQGKRDGNYFKITDGFRRTAAVQQLLEEGHEVARVPLQLEGREYNDEKRIFDMFISNDGKNLTSLEEGIGFKRLQNLGYDQTEIASKLGKTPAHVSNMVSLANAPKHIQNELQEGNISASTALEILRKGQDEEEQKEMVNQGKEKAQKEGKKKVSNKDVEKIRKKKHIEILEETLDQLIDEGVQNEKVDALEKTINKLKEGQSPQDISSVFK